MRDYLNPFFRRKEFACNCGCGLDTVDAELLAVLTDLRVYFGAEVYINSGNRCLPYNLKIGGSPKSQHIVSKAADIRVKGFEASEVAEYFRKEYPNKYGIGEAVSFVHIDVRASKARWTY